MSDYKIVQHYLTKNDCYKAGKKRSKTTGIVKHSTGANNPNLKRYIDDADNLGANQYGNHWNQSGISTCVHFFIGLDKNGDIAIYQTLPLDYRCWGCGSGSKGSYNDTHIQYEICEDGLTDEAYFTKAFDAAAWLDKYICEQCGLSASDIVSHKEACAKGYASNHGDPENWLSKFGKDMDWCRSLVDGTTTNTTATTTTTTTTTASTTATAKLTVDGQIGSKTVTRLQQVLGSTADGFIDGQPSASKKYWTSIITEACKWSGGASACVKKLQQYLKDHGYKPGTVDGLLGAKTATALQKYLIGLDYSCGSTGADGYFGTNSAKALQTWLNDD
ncbi:MAG: N-acetylmuramoyl-L-alanine amidase [Oscillospiraceae bacterium]|nr:N-acetylmuramoyl-L-alanine amidase [Oscillospiraceae bacterium]